MNTTDRERMDQGICRRVLSLVCWPVPFGLAMLWIVLLPRLSCASPVYYGRVDGFEAFQVTGVVFLAWRVFHYRKSAGCREYRLFFWLYVLFPLWGPVFYLGLSELIIACGWRIFD